MTTENTEIFKVLRVNLKPKMYVYSLSTKNYVTIEPAINRKLTQIRRDPSFFQLRAVIVYKLGIFLGVPSSHTILRGAQLKTLSLLKLPSTRECPLGLLAATVNSFSSKSLE